MGYVIKRHWAPEVAGIGIPRRDRQWGAYDAFVPHPLAGRKFVFEGAVAADIADAELAIARLDSQAAVLTDTEALARLLLRAESVASSRIEGLSISAQRLLRADADRAEGSEVRDVTALEVLANVDAMTYAMNDASGQITVARILEIHRCLLSQTRLAEHAGSFRSTQNWIGGSDYNPLSADFVPPPHEEIPKLIDDLCAFCNDDGLPAVAQAALAHAQFETIHPFVDGNGRTGRALIHVILRRRGLAIRVTPPISLILATRARDYITGLNATRYIGPPNAPEAASAENRWVSTFAAACSRAVADAETFERRVEDLQSEWRERLGTTRADSTALAVLERLPAAPIITVREAESLVGRSFAAVNGAFTSLVDAGILTQTNSVRRNRAFEARELIDAFTALERQLASPDGNTKISKPARPVPLRPRRTAGT